MLRKLIFILVLICFAGKTFSQQFKTADIANSSLMPEQNLTRNVLNLSGMWSFKVDSNNVGENEKWYVGLKQAKPIAVPASWNDQYDELRDYMGIAWYEQNTYVPKTWQGQRIFIRFGSANYAAKVWINGKVLGKHEGGHLPFAFDITDYINWNNKNKIIVQVENILKPSRVPPGNITTEGGFTNNPAGNFDFFPFCGLERPVWLFSVPQSHITNITVVSKVQLPNATVEIKIKKEGTGALIGKLTLSGNDKDFEKAFTFSGDEASVTLTVPDAHLWNVDDPYLYDLSVSLTRGSQVVDSYSLQTGIRTIAVNNSQLLLNGKPVFLKGFGKHEDFPISGKGTSYPVIVKDFSLLKWVGANSFRTSHYPYDEEYMNMADRQGILIIDEIPAVGLFFDKNVDQVNERKETCKQMIRELINRDKNHPAVLMWSVANEPGLRSSYLKKDTQDSISYNFFKELIGTIKKEDTSRPATLVGAENEPYQWLGLADVICINRYFGWYSQTGNIAEGAALLNKELDIIHDKFKKPMILTEFGADAYPGMHALTPEMFTEEYQRDFIKAYLDVLDTKNYICGAHVWAFADFKTSQGDRRFGGFNWKGVFTRDRRPKMAAYYLKSRWGVNK